MSIVHLERVPQEWDKTTKLPMEYQNNYLEYMASIDGWNVVSLNRYSEVQELLDHPMYGRKHPFLCRKRRRNGRRCDRSGVESIML
jgi:hypothetical protein